MRNTFHIVFQNTLNSFVRFVSDFVPFLRQQAAETVVENEKLAVRSDTCVHRTSYGVHDTNLKNVFLQQSAEQVTIIYELEMIKYMNSIHLLHFFNFPQNLEIKRHNGININPLVTICINFFSIPQSRFETLNYTITCKLHNHHSSLMSMKNGDCVIYM